MGNSNQFLINLPMQTNFFFFQFNNFLIKIEKFPKKIICFSIKDQHLTKIWPKNWGCHALQKFKIELGMAGSIFEQQPPDFGKIHIFWKCSNDNKIMFWYFQQHKSYKKSKSLWVHLHDVQGLKHLKLQTWGTHFRKYLAFLYLVLADYTSFFSKEV